LASCCSCMPLKLTMQALGILLDVSSAAGSCMCCLLHIPTVIAHLVTSTACVLYADAAGMDYLAAMQHGPQAPVSAAASAAAPTSASRAAATLPRPPSRPLFIRVPSSVSGMSGSSSRRTTGETAAAEAAERRQSTGSDEMVVQGAFQ
jgi:hypothetical protein